MRGSDTKQASMLCLISAEARVPSEPHVAQQITKHRGSKIDARTTRHVGYEISQRIRKRVEEVFGWFKTVGNFRKTRYRGLAVNQLAAHMLGAAYNLLRIAKLIQASA